MIFCFMTERTVKNQRHTCMWVFVRQAEKLRSPSLSKELCILSVIEILYLWKALPNCSTAKLQMMTHGKRWELYLTRSGDNFVHSFVFLFSVLPSSCACCLDLSGSILVLQGIHDASCAGLKNLLLGAINKCLHNTKDAIQVQSCLVGDAFL